MKKLALLLMLMAPLASAQDWMATSFDHTEVTPGIYMLTGADGKMSGGGIGLLAGDEYVVLIDDSFTPLGPALLEKIEELAGRPADFIINTHAHGDHTGSNQFQAESGAIIVAHDKLRSRMEGNPEQNTGPGALPIITPPTVIARLPCVSMVMPSAFMVILLLCASSRIIPSSSPSDSVIA